MQARKSLTERFWAKVNRRGPDECWLWAGSITGVGYGDIFVGPEQGVRETAHRVSWELHNGKILKSNGRHRTCVLHHCDVRACVNPAHLFLGTHVDNMVDMNRKGRGIPPPPQRGADHYNAKLTVEQVCEVRSAIGTQRAIAKRFGISKAQVFNIRKGLQWRTVPFDPPPSRRDI